MDIHQIEENMTLHFQYVFLYLYLHSGLNSIHLNMFHFLFFFYFKGQAVLFKIYSFYFNQMCQLGYYMYK